MKLVLLCAGEGKRLRPLSYKVHKSMINVDYRGKMVPNLIRSIKMIKKV